MHNNYFFLRHLSKSLEKILTGSVVSECFSQNKDELIVRFEIEVGSFFIKASLLPSFSCLSFANEFHRARKNSVDLFENVIGQRVIGIRQFNNERSFAINLSNEFSLLFKMHGNRANIMLFQNENVSDLFKNNLEADKKSNLNTLDRHIDWSFEAFKNNIDHLEKLYFTFGKLLWQYLVQQDFNSKTIEQKWEMIQSLPDQFKSPQFYLTEVDHIPRLSLVRIGNIKKESDDPIAISNDFFYTYSQVHSLQHEKNLTLSAIKGKLLNGENFYKKTSDKLQEIQEENNYKIWADLIMANLHLIQPKSERVTVQNFYHENIPTEIKLKKDLSPQKNAEAYYKKAKNQHLEVDRLQRALHTKLKELEILKGKLETAGETEDLKELKKIHSEIIADSGPKKQAISLPYHEFIVNGFKIWVGRNAISNDILTFKLGHKEDLWLHAKDVSGSHVLIKYQSGKKFPKDVIERAAQLAAYNSKRKNDSLCPVAYTPRKYVRKRKGDPAGAVVVEREDVIMVEPGSS